MREYKNLEFRPDEIELIRYAGKCQTRRVIDDQPNGEYFSMVHGGRAAMFTGWGYEEIRRVPYRMFDFSPVSDDIDIAITNVRVARLQDISEEDCCRESLQYFATEDAERRRLFKHIYDANCKDDQYAYDRNPWVWVIDFKKYLKQSTPPTHTNTWPISIF